MSEEMPGTVALVNAVCSVSVKDLPEPWYPNQVHKHTFTCTKRGEKSCRFGIPYWPMDETVVLVPMAASDNRRKTMAKTARRLKEILETKVYGTLGEFLIDNRLDRDKYMNVILSILTRPTLIFKREMSEIYTNTFNPWLARVIGSNIDLQFILDEYSCASYVVVYVSKSNRGISKLQRELIRLQEENPEMDYMKLVKKIGV